MYFYVDVCLLHAFFRGKLWLNIMCLTTSSPAEWPEEEAREEGEGEECRSLQEDRRAQAPALLPRGQARHV